MRRILADLFTAALVLYLLLFLLESVVPGIVSSSFSLNYLLVPVLVLGVVSSIFPKTELDKPKDIFRWSDLWLSVMLSLAGGWLIYYKIELELKLRLVIAALSTILILTMSMLVILPENFKLPKLKFKNRYWWLILLLPLIWFGISRIPGPAKEATTTRLPSDQYKVVLINRNPKKEYGQTYKKLLVNNGYTNVVTEVKDSYPETTTGATVMYGPDDAVAGEEVTEIIGWSYSEIQSVPMPEPNPRTIIVIIK